MPFWHVVPKKGWTEGRGLLRGHIESFSTRSKKKKTTNGLGTSYTPCRHIRLTYALQTRLHARPLRSGFAVPNDRRVRVLTAGDTRSWRGLPGSTLWLMPTKNETTRPMVALYAHQKVSASCTARPLEPGADNVREFAACQVQRLFEKIVEQALIDQPVDVVGYCARLRMRLHAGSGHWIRSFSSVLGCRHVWPSG